MSLQERPVPPAGEEIHLPGPSIQPVLLAVAITMALLGATTSIVLVIAGVVLAVATIVRWVRDVRHDIDQLPVDHR